MAVRSRDVYRGKHKRRSIIGGVAAVVLLLIVMAIVMFYSFQKYISYEQGGVKLELPILATSSPADNGGEKVKPGPQNIDLVVGDADYGSVDATAGAGLSNLKALFVPAADIAADFIGQYIALMDDYGAEALVLEVKPDSGQLLWESSVPMAGSFALSGNYDLKSLVSTLKEQGIYTVAQLSCCLDTALASRNSPIALKNSFGEIYTDAFGYWLDPYNGDVRNYLSDVCADAAKIGFDELLLKYVEMPATDSELVHSEKMSFNPTPSIGVSGLALRLTRDLDSYGIPVSALISYSSLSKGDEARSGQNIELFFKIFDRVCCWAGTQFEHQIYRENLSKYITIGSVDERFIPIMSYAPDTNSWIVKVPDQLIKRGDEKE